MGTAAKTDAAPAESTDTPEVLGASTIEPVDPKEPPRTMNELHTWVATHAGVNLVRTPIIAGHAAPMDYVAHSFFEGRIPTGPATPDAPERGADCVVWANRGGGKTFLGALATLLDLIFKPTIQIRILGGSLEQSRRMYEHLRSLFERPTLAPFLKRGATRHGLSLNHGSRVELLAASQTSVRGTRVQKILCDEVELFDPDVWDACQLATRSIAYEGPWGDTVRGSVHALSTMHRPFGLMWKLVERSLDGGNSIDRPVFRWGLLDVLEKCTDKHICSTCVLQGECTGRAKLDRVSATPASGVSLSIAGHIRVTDATAMKRRVGRATWNAEMLCLKPRRDDCVYAEFDPSRHVYIGDRHLAAHPGRWVAGMDFGIRSEAALLLGRVDNDGTLYIVRERVLAGETLSEHIRVLREWLTEFGSTDAPADLSFIGVDPAGKSRSDQTGESNADVLNEARFVVKARRLDTEAGIAMVRARLSPAADKQGNGEPVPRLFVHASCSRLIECLQRYHYPENKPESMEPVKDGVDHACDALRYLIINLDRPGHTKTSRYNK
jgi:hypothetical protein